MVTNTSGTLGRERCCKPSTMPGFIPHVEAGCSQPNCKLLFSEQTRGMADVRGERSPAGLSRSRMMAQTLQVPAISSSLVFPFTRTGGGGRRRAPQVGLVPPGLLAGDFDRAGAEGPGRVGPSCRHSSSLPPPPGAAAPCLLSPFPPAARGQSVRCGMTQTLPRVGVGSRAHRLRI